MFPSFGRAFMINISHTLVTKTFFINKGSKSLFYSNLKIIDSIPAPRVTSKEIKNEKKKNSANIFPSLLAHN